MDNLSAVYQWASKKDGAAAFDLKISGDLKEGVYYLKAFAMDDWGARFGERSGPSLLLVFQSAVKRITVLPVQSPC